MWGCDPIQLVYLLFPVFMIDVYYANRELQFELSDVRDERELVATVISNLRDYDFATTVKHPELDIAFAAVGGQTEWQGVSRHDVSVSPEPKRDVNFGDILVEQPQGYVHLCTQLGFIPLPEVITSDNQLTTK